jgi:hypothetical protein
MNKLYNSLPVPKKEFQVILQGSLDKCDFMYKYFLYFGLNFILKVQEIIAVSVTDVVNSLLNKFNFIFCKYYYEIIYFI